MSILLLNNPRSGRGTGADIAAELARHLRDAGHRVIPAAAGPELDPGEFRLALRASDLLVVAGGDGTLHHALPAIIETGLPVYHFPLGTENLFAREFGMDRSPSTLLRAIERARVRICDAARCNGRCFSLMVGVGFDARVVERLAASRAGGTTRAAYVRCAVRELAHLRVPRFRVLLDGRIVVDGVSGTLVIANSRRYAARLDPARQADMSDGALDVVFYPHRTAFGLLGWLAATAAGTHLDMKGVVSARGEHIRVELDEAAPHQIDGEAAGPSPALGHAGVYGLDVRILPGALRVLTPT